MIFNDKKRTLYALSIGIMVILLFIFVRIPGIYEWQNRKIYPFSHFSIEQIGQNIEVFTPSHKLTPEGVTGEIILNIDHENKKIIFQFILSQKELKSGNTFSLNGLIGYDMCYENKYGQHCFGKTK